MSQELKQATRVADVDDWIATFGEEEISLIFEQAREEMRKDRDVSFLRAFEFVKVRWSAPVEPTADEVAEDARRNSEKRERAIRQATEFDNFSDWGRP